MSRQVGPADSLWRVKFVATDAAWRPIGATVAEDRPAGKTTIRDYAGAPLLTVERLERPKDRPTAKDRSAATVTGAQADGFDIGPK